MSKDPLVTREAVFAAADMIMSSGKKPTWLLVRQELGGGSPRDICPLVAEWKSASAVSENKVERATGRPQVERIVRETTERLTEVVSREIEAKVAVERRVAEQRIHEALAEADEFAEALSASDAEIGSLQGQLHQTAEALTTERARSTALERQLAADHEERLLAEARGDEVRRQVQDLIVQRDRLTGTQEAASRKIDALQNEVTELRLALENERSGHAGLEHERVQLARQIDQQNAELQKLRAEQASAGEHAAQALETLRLERDEAQRKAGDLAGEAVVLRSQVRTAMESLRNWMTRGGTPRDFLTGDGDGGESHGH